jgi:hypothetical protein
MKVLLACEESGIVTEEFRKLGNEAFSCDLYPTSGSHPEWHLQEDVIPLLQQDWDLIIAFPPCTHLASSGAAWFEKKRADGRQQQGVDFFLEFTRAKSPKVAIENPVGIMSTQYRKPDQIIQPYMFGDSFSKKTCLWLKGLPPLQPTSDLKAQTKALPDNQRQRLHYLPPSADRWKLRSTTYKGIAEAMANQWGGLK